VRWSRTASADPLARFIASGTLLGGGSQSDAVPRHLRPQLIDFDGSESLTRTTASPGREDGGQSRRDGEQECCATPEVSLEPLSARADGCTALARCTSTGTLRAVGRVGGGAEQAMRAVSVCFSTPDGREAGCRIERTAAQHTEGPRVATPHAT